MTSEGYEYPGGELEFFEGAQNWKTYWGSLVKPFLGDSVGEVGAGIGANTVGLSKDCPSWTCIEPDASLAARIEQRRAAGEIGPNCKVVVSKLNELSAEIRFDTILYIDVLEHIPGDSDELIEASKRLRPNGYLVVLSPAHQWLFTAFDSAVGHVRRYTIKSLKNLNPPGLKPCVFRYVDSVGLLASLANALILKSPNPTNAQIQFWDRFMVPVSRTLDRLMRFRVGKSVLAVWQAR